MSGASSALWRRVVVTGLAGSGKSTFAVALALALAAETGLPVIHLDLSFWQPGWVAPSETEWREKQRGGLAGDAWIANGHYHETLDLRLERADTVVVLDMPWWLCSGRALWRRVGFRMPDELPEGCHYSAWMRLRDEWRLAVRIWRKRRSEPEREYEIISRQGQHLVVRVLTSKRAVSDFLEVWTSSARQRTTVDPAQSDPPLTPVLRAWLTGTWGAGRRSEVGIDHASALTSYAVQGSTRDVSTSRIGATTTRAETYVDTTRGRQANHLYLTAATDPLDGEALPRLPAQPADEDVAHRLEHSSGELSPIDREVKAQASPAPDSGPEFSMAAMNPVESGLVS